MSVDRPSARPREASLRCRTSVVVKIVYASRIMTTTPGRDTGALIAWSGLFGLVSFELFGQFENVVTDRAAFFDHAAARLGVLTGLPA